MPGVVRVLHSPTDIAAAPFLEARRSRQQVGEVDRARLAAWYVAQVCAGVANPSRVLAARYAETSEKTWANHFLRMRTRVPALLTPAPRRGVAGGELTPHAESLLRMMVMSDELRDLYESERLVFPPAVRKERRTAAPKRSVFASVDGYDRAFEEWLTAGEWLMETPLGAPGAEGPDDWLNRVLGR